MLINVGPLTSFNSVHYYLAGKLKNLREDYLSGKTPEIIFDLRNVEYRRMHISALAALLSISKRVRDFTNKPIPLMLKWDPEVQAYWADIGFFEIDKRFEIFQWPEGYVGGFERGKTNPWTKILYFADINPQEQFESLDDLIEFKKILKQKIAPNFLLRCAAIFNGLNGHFGNMVSNTALELIVNSLIHAESVAFVGIARSHKRISISVCDTGIGFIKSLARTYPKIISSSNITHAGGIILGSLIQKKEHGLRLAINEVLGYEDFVSDFDNENEGWVVVSSYDCEVRWQKRNWGIAKQKFDALEGFENFPNENYFLGEPMKEFVEREKILEGYWKRYSNFLMGTRITFEILTH
jgi:hypothetical protein